MKAVFDDPIIRETQKYREEYAASFGYDLAKVVADLQSRQGHDGRVVVDRIAIETSELDSGDDAARNPEKS